MGSRHRELRRELRMESLNVVLPIEPSGDSGLVSDDEHKEPCIIQQFNCGFGAVDPPETTQ